MKDLIPDAKIEELRKELYESTKPIFFFDDDPDGLSSFLMFYKAVGDGKGIPIKSAPELDINFTSKVTEFSPDKVFILDKAVVTQEFVDSLRGTPCFWLDHHKPIDLKHVKYYNPRSYTPDQHKPTSYWAYRVADKKDHLWIASVGCIGDWYIPEFLEEFVEKYPDILAKADYEDPGDVLFDTRLGELVRVFSFLLKGPTKEVIKCMKIMTRIKEPYEILDQTSSRGTYIWKRYMTIRKLYDDMFKEALSCASDDMILLYKYTDRKMSFTADLSNELLHKFPDKVIIIARERDGEMRCSLRSGKYVISKILAESLKDIDGYGGGHEHACGAGIKVHDFDRFIENMRSELKKEDNK